LKGEANAADITVQSGRGSKIAQEYEEDNSRLCPNEDRMILAAMRRNASA
jgi:hypothetical protein